jgi:hypothetical protein
VVLIALSIVAVASIVRAADSTTEFYAARDTLTPGTVLTKADVVVTDAKVEGEAYLQVVREPAWGQVVTTVIRAGELVPVAALTEQERFDGRPVALRTSLPVGASIDRGSLVDVWLTVVQDDGAPLSTLVVGGVVVDEVERDAGAFAVSGSETVHVVVPTADVPQVLDAIATQGDIAVVGLGGASG